MKKAFTLAEVLITLAIIGVVAAVSIPSVVANTQQKEFQTGLRKAVSVLNSSITMNMAIDGESPYENNNLYRYLGRHMSVMKSMALTPMSAETTNSWVNIAFYTTDGMRFEFSENNNGRSLKLHENPNLVLRNAYWKHAGADITKGTFAGFHPDNDETCGKSDSKYTGFVCSRCGSYGLTNNVDDTISTPCFVTVDVNGDRKPFPVNASCFDSSCKSTNKRKYSDTEGKKLTDTFTIMITDKQAIPYGVAAQRAMYQAQKAK